MTDKANLNRPSIRQDKQLYVDAINMIKGMLDGTHFAEPFRSGFEDAMDNFKLQGGALWWKDLHDYDRQNYIDGLDSMRQNYQAAAAKQLREVQRRQCRAAEDGFNWGRIVIAHLHRDPMCSQEIADLVGVAIP